MNSSGHYHLALSGFEIYGDVVQHHQSMEWHSDAQYKSDQLSLHPVYSLVPNMMMNTGCRWQTVRTLQSMDFAKETGIAELSVLVRNTGANSSNERRFMFGIVDEDSRCAESGKWTGGLQETSCFYIAGTGHIVQGFDDNAETKEYGCVWSNSIGVVITAKVDSSNHTLEFLVNGESQVCCTNSE